MRFITNKIWRFHGRAFERLFNLFRGIGSWPIAVSFIKDDQTYKISDANGPNSLYVSRTSRIPKYRGGLRHRRRILVGEYMLGEIPLEPGGFCVDVGANIGEVTKILEDEYNARVIAIEPDRREFKSLCRNISSSSFPLNMGLWYEADDLTLFDRNDTGDSSFLETSGDSGSNSYTVSVDTLDKVVSGFIASDENIQLIKVEAEGAEPEVLLGARKTLNRTRFVVVDVGPERGEEKESTLIPVLRLMRDAEFVPVLFNPMRHTLLFAHRCETKFIRLYEQSLE